MISSSSQQAARGLDAMLIVYSLIEGHPAAMVCEQFIRAHTDWFTTVFTLLEAKAILTKVYGVERGLASQRLLQLAAGPIVVLAVDRALTLAAMQNADTLGIDLTDAVLLQAVQAQGATWLATDDSKLAQACRQVGIMPETPIDARLREQMASWEATNLPMKGLPRVLWYIHQWLSRHAPQLAPDFWSQTGGGSHLP